MSLSRLIDILRRFSTDRGAFRIGLPHNGSRPAAVLREGTWEMKMEFSWQIAHALMEGSQQGEVARIRTAGQLAEAASQQGGLIDGG